MYTKALNEISVSAAYVLYSIAVQTQQEPLQADEQGFFHSKIIMEKLAINLELRYKKTAQCTLLYKL